MEVTWFVRCRLLQVLLLVVFTNQVSSTGRLKYNCLLPEEPQFGAFAFEDEKRTLHLLCIHGYTLIGDAARQCVDYRWTGVEGDCVKPDSIEERYGCIVPKEPLFGIFTFDDSARALYLSCAPTYYRIGDEKRICRDGQWTGRKGDCIDSQIIAKQCPELKSPNNGRVIVEGRNEGDSAHYFCDEGFVIEGSSKVTCQPGRMWDGTLPICSSRQTVEDLAHHLKDTMIDSLAGATADSETGAQSRLSPGKSGLDIVLLVDSSSSIGPNSLNSAKKFMKMLVKIFGVSPEANGGQNGTRFALLTFSDKADVVFNVNDQGARSIEAVNSKIDGITNTGGGTDFKKAFEAVAFRVFYPIIHRDEKRNKHATRAIFVITDAQETSSLDANRMYEIRKITDPLKKENSFEIFSIGIGSHIDKFMLAEIASTPEVEHVFLIDQFKDLEKIGDIISERNIDYGQCGISGKTEISGGSQRAAKGAWPWLGWLSSVAVTDDGKTLVKTCGGALLCERWFMTAASCVSWTAENGTVIPNDPEMVNLYLSDHLLFKKDNDEAHAIVSDIHIHENYTGDVISDLNVRINDIALLDLGENKTTRQPLDKFLRPLCFPANTTLAIAGAEWKSIQSVPESNVGYTAGWGHSPYRAEYAYDKYPFEELNQNERPVLQRELCRKRFPDLDLDRFFCVGKVTTETDTCVGDIGGPYMVKMSNKRYVTMGLALNTTNCEEPYQFSIFLKTIHPEVIDWVEPILNGCNRVEEVED